jgi:hypothetical protein
VKDAASLSIVSSSDRKKVEAQLVAKLSEMDKRLADIQLQAPQPSQPGLSHPQRPVADATAGK